MKRLVTGFAVLGLMLALCAVESQAQGHHSGRRHYPTYYRSSYGRIHPSPYGYPSWNYCGPKYRCRPYPYYRGYPGYYGCYPSYGCYPYYGGGGVYGAYGWGSGGLVFGIGF